MLFGVTRYYTFYTFSIICVILVIMEINSNMNPPWRHQALAIHIFRILITSWPNTITLSDSRRTSCLDRTTSAIPSYPPSCGAMAAPHAASPGDHRKHKPRYKNQNDEFFQVCVMTELVKSASSIRQHINQGAKILSFVILFQAHCIFPCRR